jgi:hypothetical protein
MARDGQETSTEYTEETHILSYQVLTSDHVLAAPSNNETTLVRLFSSVKSIKILVNG